MAPLIEDSLPPIAAVHFPIQGSVEEEMGRGIPRQRPLNRNYTFSPNYNPPRVVKSPPNDREWDSPPLAPVLQGKGVKVYESFFVNAGDLDFTREIKLTVEFPSSAQQDRTNDISMYFKRFATVLVAVHPGISILNWEHPTLNPIKKAVDVLPNEASIKQYFSGVIVQTNRQKIKGFVKIQPTTPFSVIKRNDRLWTWLTNNKVFAHTTQLGQ